MLKHRSQAQGNPVVAIDGLLAATAIHYRLTIVSRNVTDFANTQAQILNPWEA
jgi:predicted nucleic acid-binding protein